MKSFITILTFKWLPFIMNKVHKVYKLNLFREISFLFHEQALMLNKQGEVVPEEEIEFWIDSALRFLGV